MTQNIRPDNKGRINLGDISKDISSYKMTVEDNGRIILEPYIEIPLSELAKVRAISEKEGEC